MRMFVHRHEPGGPIASAHEEPQPDYAEEELDTETSDELAAFFMPMWREAKRAALAAAFDAQVAAGMAFGGKILQIDDASRANIAAMATRAGFVALSIPGVTWPGGGYPWRMADNSTLSLTAPQFIAMAQAAADRYAALFARRSALKDAIAAAATAGELDAIDVAAGW